MINKPAKITLYLLSVIITFSMLLYLIAAAAGGNIRYGNDKDKLYQCYGAAGCIYLMDKNSVPVDKTYRENVRNQAEQFFENTTISKLGSSEIAMMICIDSIFEFGKSDVLFEEMNGRYNEKERLFDEYYGDSYSELDDDGALAMRIASTDAMWISLNSFGLKNDEYDLPQLLADAFNANLDKYDHNDIYGKYWTVSSELENIFYYFLDTGDIGRINYEKIWETLGADYVRDLFATNENSETFRQNNSANISGILTDTRARVQLGAAIELPYTPQKYYNSLDSAESFNYSDDSENNKNFEYNIFVDLSQPSDLKLSENQYFVKNINQWLIENYNANW